MCCHSHVVPHLHTAHAIQLHQLRQAVKLVEHCMRSATLLLQYYKLYSSAKLFSTSIAPRLFSTTSLETVQQHISFVYKRSEAYRQLNFWFKSRGIEILDRLLFSLSLLTFITLRNFPQYHRFYVLYRIGGSDLQSRSYEANPPSIAFARSEVAVLSGKKQTTDVRHTSSLTIQYSPSPTIRRSEILDQKSPTCRNMNKINRH